MPECASCDSPTLKADLVVSEAELAMYYAAWCVLFPHNAPSHRILSPKAIFVELAESERDNADILGLSQLVTPNSISVDVTRMAMHTMPSRRIAGNMRRKVIL